MVGWMKDQTGRFSEGLIALATLMGLNILLILIVARAMSRDDQRRVILAAR
jgi:hypothetical protein